MSDSLKNARFFGDFDVGTVPMIAGQVVVHDMANLVERGCLEQDFGLILQKIRGHIDDESLVPHFLVTNNFGKHVANGRGIVPCFNRMIDDPQTDFIACTQLRHRLIDLALIQRFLLLKAAHNNASSRDLKAGVTRGQLGVSGIGCKQ